jgi:hypothetical protein
MSNILYKIGVTVGRPKLNMIFHSVKLLPSWTKRFARVKEHLGISKSDVIRAGTEKELNELEKKIEKKAARKKA